MRKEFTGSGTITLESMGILDLLLQTAVFSISFSLTVETGKLLVGGELMDGLGNHSFVGFIVRLRNFRYLGTEDVCRILA